MSDYNKYMAIALDEASKCIESGDVPVGCVIVHNDEIIARAGNKIEASGNPLMHAEIAAVNQAVANIGHKHLLGCEMYITLEPCAMCAGAIVLARIDKLIYGAYDPKTGAAGSLYSICDDMRLNHRCDVISGIMEEECSILLKSFFSEIRKKKNAKQP